jgi:predicted nucleotidyltransferase
VATVNPRQPLNAVVQRLESASSVAAIALVGSHASGAAESGSDFDVFVYTDGPLWEVRLHIAEEFADPNQWQSVHDSAFGDGDVWRIKNGGAWLDLIY